MPPPMPLSGLGSWNSGRSQRSSASSSTNRGRIASQAPAGEAAPAIAARTSAMKPRTVGVSSRYSSRTALASIPLGLASRPAQPVDLVLLAHDQVLEQVLERLRARLLAGVRDHRVQRRDRLVLVLDQVVDLLPGVGLPAQPADLRGRIAAERADLLHEQLGVAELGLGEVGQLAGEGLDLEAEHAAGGERELERRALLELERDVQAFEDLGDV